MYEINEQDKLRLLALCKLKSHEEVPREVEAAYWRFKRRWDRIGNGRVVPDGNLVLMAMEHEESDPHKQADPKPDPVELWQAGHLKHGDPVMVKWRNREVEATFITPTADSRHCLVHYKSEERKIPVRDVHVLQEA